MKFQELSQKTASELDELLGVKQNELRELTFKSREGQLKQVRQIRDAKRFIARIHTARSAK